MSEQRVVLRELIAQYNNVATAQGRDSQEAENYLVLSLNKN